MLYLADTNILLRSAEPAHPTHVETVNAVTSLLSQGETVCITPQNIIEFWNVATRPAADNGLGFTTAQTEAEVLRLMSLLTVLDDLPAIFPEWQGLVIAHTVQGKQVHDTRLVAVMKVYNVTHLLTYNKKHFQRFSGITVLAPSDL